MRCKGYSFFIFFIHLLLIFSSCNRRAELEGLWVGCEVRKPLIDWSLTVKGNQFSLVCEDLGVWYKGLLALNKNSRLKKIDLEVTDTAIQTSNGKTSLGIYEVDGDRLTIIVAELGDHLRPLSFDDPGKSIELYFTKKYRNYESRLALRPKYNTSQLR